MIGAGFGLGRALYASRIRRGIYNGLVVGQKIRTGGTSHVCTNTSGNKRIYRGIEDLVAFGFPGFIGCLENKHFAVRAEIRFRIVASKSELPDVQQVFLLWILNHLGLAAGCWAIGLFDKAHKRTSRKEAAKL
jgi:hypothetical protein